MYFCVNEFEVGVNDSIFSGNEQQKVHIVIVKPNQIHELGNYLIEKDAMTSSLVIHRDINKLTGNVLISEFTV